jgi:hypothetical protein
MITSLPLRHGTCDGSSARAGVQRPGQRVIINPRGDLIVRPSFLEASIQRATSTSSVVRHLLTDYQKSMVAVIHAQFGRKRFRDGMQVKELLQFRDLGAFIGASLVYTTPRWASHARVGDAPLSSARGALKLCGGQ